MATLTVPFTACSPMMIAGPTNSGKTFWVRKLLLNNAFTETVASVLYCYGVYQDIFSELESDVKKKGSHMELHEGLPSGEKLKKLKDGKFHIIVLDDLMEMIVNNPLAEAMFTKYCHHFHMSTIFITQNIFTYENQNNCLLTA